ncbi:TIGR00341 family protein [Halobacterium salinarum]|uniref:TIGR00341 family protein n=1 Tax=Halobacterium salinarum TaxID=2242 RepID=UPI0025528B5A|nr:TIGR00341 family protein [Halobacterium salinarum]MDL0119243.1 TIGR00341 family protein [Halobacterium salinarum]
MRLVQVTVPTGRRDAVLAALDDEGVDYVVTPETASTEYTAVVHFPLPTAAVSDVLDALQDVGLSQDAYTVVVGAETVVSRRFDELDARYSADSDAADDHIAREELVARAADLAPNRVTYAVLTLVSTIIATAGLLLDSPATVVGSMVIAPLLGPAMSASVGTVVDDDDLFARGIRLQVVGVALAVVGAAAFAFLVKTTHLVPPGLDVLSLSEVRERLRPDFLSLVVALGSGVAGVYSLMSGVSSALVGVAIAVALIPPAATVGIGIAWGVPTLAVGSAVLVAVNVLSINLAALVGLWYSGYRPQRFFAVGDAHAALVKRGVTLAVAIAVLSAFLGGVTLASVEAADTEQAVDRAIDDVTAQAAHTSVVDVQFQYDRGLVSRQPHTVIVTLGIPPGQQYPALAQSLAKRIETDTGRELAVEVRYVETQRVAPSRPNE